jgi:hypothetical protein
VVRLRSAWEHAAVRAGRTAGLLEGDTVHGGWVEIVGAATLSDVATEAALDAAGAFGFVRLEDGAFRPNAKREFWFNATGDQAKVDETDPHANELGRLYRLQFDKADPLAGATLTQRSGWCRWPRPVTRRPSRAWPSSSAATKAAVTG